MQKKSKFPFWILGLFFWAGVTVSCNSGNGDSSADTTAETEDMIPASDETGETATANIAGTSADVQVTGKAVFTEEAQGRVKLNVELSIPSKADQQVAVHLHENGDCGDGGKDAKGHWNPTEDEHGQWASDHFHRGDIGNIKLDANGNGSLEMTTDLWQVGGDDSIKNVIGKAVIVHEGSDDFVTQPTGDAGGRIGCAVVQ